MKCYNLPQHTRGVIFDIDSTLYTSSRYAFEQVDIQVRRLAHLRGQPPAMMRCIINSWRSKWSKTHGGQKISLGNTLTHFGIPIEKSIEWRRRLLEPSLYLSADDALRECLTALKEHFALICVTNNPVLPARKTLQAIGIDGIITDIVGLDTCCVSKPAREPFELALKIIGMQATECVSVGDRFDLDIALPLKMGMGGILVDGVADVLCLNDILIR